ncbi:MAG: thymidine kinase [Cryomorphaceae bacterium]|nr:thymidine kinase [Flavobacteriales bacterium]
MFLEDTRNSRRAGEGWIEVICGSMFSGKTEELIRRINRAKIAHQKVIVFKPIIEDRYHRKNIVTHNRDTHDSTPVNSAEEILHHAEGSEVVGIDEAQFFDAGLPDVCNELANRGTRVMVAGLDMDFEGKPFGSMPHLMAIAEYVTKVHAICVKTGKLAHYSHRISDRTEQVTLGEADQYQPLSRKAYLEEQSRGKNIE